MNIFVSNLSLVSKTDLVTPKPRRSTSNTDLKTQDFANRNILQSGFNEFLNFSQLKITLFFKFDVTIKNSISV